MTNTVKRPALTVYCASAKGDDPVYLETAVAFGELLARRGFDLVYGGGSIGLMGAISRSAQESGARVTGIITHQFMKLEQGWLGCDELVVVDSMRQRKQQLEERADAFAILPGGLGTYEEFFETFVGRVIGRHSKPIGLLNTNSCYEPLIGLISHGVASGFVRSAARDLLLHDTDPHRLIDAIHAQMNNAQATPHDPRAMLPMHGPHG